MNSLHSRTVELLGSLIEFDTTSRESNLHLIYFVRDYLVAKGVSCELIFNQEKSKANLLATLGPQVEGGIMLSGHTDVVPVTGQQWHYPPFQLTSEQGRHYGRGTADMKGFIACMLALVAQVDQARLQRPLWLALSYDEEVGCLGVHGLLDELAQRPVKPELCLVGEPTSMQPVNGHKGKVALRCQIVGHECHSAYTPQGVNAINYAAQLIHFILKRDERLAEEVNPAFDPPFSTLHIGTITGGGALNIVPNHCQFDMELRYLPQHSPDTVIDDIKAYANHTLVPQMQQRFSGSAIAFNTLAAYPALYVAQSEPWVQRLLKWTQQTATTTVAFGTEAGLFHQQGITTVVCGPGSMAQGHKPDEYIEDAQIQQCLQLLVKMVETLYVTAQTE
ncbi:acetylornithine deacetylase [Rosenbergiella australiborealis]|nr:acetylornithine deacetylase [Rosenbergiella australiborealis]